VFRCTNLVFKPRRGRPPKNKTNPTDASTQSFTPSAGNAQAIIPSTTSRGRIIKPTKAIIENQEEENDKRTRKELQVSSKKQQLRKVPASGTAATTFTRMDDWNL
jgi:hypothetical protein